METQRLKQLQEEYEKISDEKQKMDVLVDIGVELRSYDVQGAANMAEKITSRSKEANYPFGDVFRLRRSGSKSSDLNWEIFYLYAAIMLYEKARNR